jgi:hypothetical protein
MRYSNLEVNNRLTRDPFWEWAEETRQDPFDTNQLKVLCVTWNMHGQAEPESFNDLLRPDIHHDIYAIAS